MITVDTSRSLLRIGTAVVQFDREATARDYTAQSTGSPEQCGCLPCRNFTVARGVLYTAEERRLFDQLGIDWHKESEIYHNARLKSGRHLYGGWFNLEGRLVEGSGITLPGTLVTDFTPTSLHFKVAIGIVPNSFEGQLIEIAFQAEVPWVIVEAFEGPSE